MIDGCVAAERQVLAEQAEEEKESKDGPSIKHEASGTNSSVAVLSVHSRGFGGQKLERGHYWLLRDDPTPDWRRQGINARGMKDQIRENCHPTLSSLSGVARGSFRI